MHASRVGRRVATTVSGLLIAGAAALAATPANAASPVPQGESHAAAARPQAPAAQPRGKVVARLPLSVRERPTTNSRYLGSLQPGAVVSLRCKVRSQNVDGNNLWYRLGGGRSGYVAARYVQNLSPVPYC
ncbi:SH3 domain-containing protein [Streptomyces sp. NPDC047002]|uniref:SH3 domain-containing protein n=1 Tax=Streptomyces sp. NPDC047002 TaxID=3155475 RepID=UPI003455177B